MIHAPAALAQLSLALTAASICYTSFALVRVLALRLPKSGNETKPAITVLKPLFGLEPQLEENLASFCDQQYPRYQVIFAASDPDDPALAVARRLRDARPRAAIAIASGGGVTPLVNPKIENLVAAMPLATGEVILIADSDIHVSTGYLDAIAAAFADSDVGAVTALYGARATAGLVAHLGALHVNDEFTPSVLVATALQPLRYCLGATMAVRRSVLEAIGGIEKLGATLADDYALGALASGKGYRVAFAATIPLTLIAEPRLGELIARELRWARTIRAVRPLGYAGSVLTLPLPFALLTLLLWPDPAIGLGIFLLALALRVALHLAARRRLGVPDRPQPWLVPLREALSLGVWALGLFGGVTRWRSRNLAERASGSEGHAKG